MNGIVFGQSAIPAFIAAMDAIAVLAIASDEAVCRERQRLLDSCPASPNDPMWMLIARHGQ